MTIDPTTLTFGNVLADKLARVPDKLFLHNLADGRKWTYAEFAREAGCLASGLLREGVGPRDHVAVMMENRPEQLLSYFALGKLGACTVPVNTGARGDLLVYFLTHADCSTVIVEQNLVARVIEVADSLPLLKRIFVLADGESPALNSHGCHVPLLPFARLLSCDEGPLPYEPVFSDLAFLMFTSGTTGPSKAIMYTQAHTLYWGWDYAQHHHYTADDTLYVYLPLFHGNGWLCNTLGAFMAGGTVALARRFSASRFWYDVAMSGATVTNCLGAVATFLWTQPPGPQDRDHRMLRMGVSPVPTFGLAFQERFGVTIMSAYGLTDYCMATAYSALHSRDKLGSCGLARNGVHVRIADENDLPLPPGTPGEIQIRSDNPWGAAIGYYKMPEASLAARRNMWFHTGDRGYLDADGFLYYKDRIKDAIRRRGENISAFEVESAVLSHPAVQVAAAYPVTADSTEDEVAVSVVLRPSLSLSEAELIEHCRKNLAYFMVPRYVEFVDALPMTLSQKVEKYRLKARAQDRLREMWDRVAAGIVLER